MTLDVPLHLLNALDPVQLGWLAPGFVADKASALIRSLPKAMRRNYVPAPDFGRAFYEAFPQPSADAITGELARFLSRATGATVTALDFEPGSIEPHLHMNLRLRDEQGKVLATSRDLEALRAKFGGRAGDAFAARAGRRWRLTACARSRPRRFRCRYPVKPACRPIRRCWTRATAWRCASSPIASRRRTPIRWACAACWRSPWPKVKQARKRLPVGAKTGLLYAAIESQERLRGDLVDAAMNAVLAEGLEEIRDATAFEQRREHAARALFGEAMSRLKLAETILALVAELKPMLEAPLMGWARGNLDDMEAQLAGLIHPGFLRDTPANALAQYPRYLKAMILRTERAKRDPPRDQARMLELHPFLEALEAGEQQGLRDRPQWQALRWDLEELRVSLFAQELGARTGISAKKLAQRVAALRQA